MIEQTDGQVSNDHLSQNPWKETDPAILSRHNVALIRRRSGGGTVYHVSDCIMETLNAADSYEHYGGFSLY